MDFLFEHGRPARQSRISVLVFYGYSSDYLVEIAAPLLPHVGRCGAIHLWIKIKYEEASFKKSETKMILLKFRDAQSDFSV